MKAGRILQTVAATAPSVITTETPGPSGFQIQNEQPAEQCAEAVTTSELPGPSGAQQSRNDEIDIDAEKSIPAKKRRRSKVNCRSCTACSKTMDRNKGNAAIECTLCDRMYCIACSGLPEHAQEDDILDFFCLFCIA